jgi:Domain of unknown function (DUF2520).
MEISILGAGNIAWYFGKKWHEQQLSVKQVIARNHEAGIRLAKEIHAEFVSTFDLQKKYDIILLAVPDDVLMSLDSSQLPKAKLYIHASGSVLNHQLSLPQDSLVCIWPIYSIRKEHLPTQSDVPLVLSVTNDIARVKATFLAENISKNITLLDDHQKSIAHLCAVVGNNFSNYLFSICEQLCGQNQLAFDVIKPILQQTTDILNYSSPSDHQTGPAIRGDIHTLQKHIELLKEYPQWQKIYKLISEAIQKHGRKVKKVPKS